MSFKAVLEADIKGFSSNIDKAISDVDRLEKTTLQKLSKVGDSFIKAGKVASVFSGAVLAGTTAVAVFARKTGDMANNLLSATVALDSSADMLQEYKLISIEAGTDTEAFSSAVQALTRRLKEVGGDGDDTTDYINKLGVAMLDTSGQMRRTGDITNDIVRSLASMENVSERNVIASQLFGRQWVSIAPILGLGADGIEQVRAKAHELGIVLSGDALDAANKFSIEMNVIDARLSAVKDNLASKLAPLLSETIVPIIENKVIPALTDFGEKLGGIVDSFNALPQPTKEFILGVTGVAIAIGPILLALGGILKALPLLKAGFAALTGPIGAITLAVAGLTAGIIYFVNRANEATTASEALAEANKRVEASVRKEKAELEKLLSIARDETKSKDMRLDAIRKLNSISEEYLGFITLETVNTDAAKNAVNGYTTAIERNARQKAISDKISKLYAEQLEYEEKIARETQKIEEDKAKGFFGSNILSQSAFKIRRAEFQNELDNINESIKAYESLSEQYVATGETGAETANKMAAAIVKTGDVAKLDTFQKLIGEQLNVRDAITKTVSTIEDLQSKLVKLQLGILPSTNVRQELAETQQQINDLSTALDLLTGKRELNIDVKTKISGIEAAENKFLKDGAIVVPPIDTSLLENSLGQAKEMVAITSQDLGSLLSTGISMFAQTIGDAFAGNWDGLGAGLLKAVGSLAQQFGGLVIGMAIAADKLKKIIVGNPLAAIAAGAALIALGAAASGAAQKMISSATGGGGGYSSAPSLRNTGPSYGPSDYRGPYQDDFKVEFKIGTNELVGVLNTAEQRRNRL